MYKILAENAGCCRKRNKRQRETYGKAEKTDTKNFYPPWNNHIVRGIIDTGTIPWKKKFTE